MKAGTVIARPVLAAILLTLAACGGGSGDSTPPVTGLAPTLASIQDNVFTVTCAVSNCHGGAGAQYGLRLDPGFSPGNLIKSSIPRGPNLIPVGPADPHAGLLIQKRQG